MGGTPEGLAAALSSASSTQAVAQLSLFVTVFKRKEKLQVSAPVDGPQSAVLVTNFTAAATHVDRKGLTHLAITGYK